MWQLQYLVSQGLYVLLDFSSTRESEPNLANPQLLAENFGNLWRILTDIPVYKQVLRGRIFPDLVNEPSRWGCQWTSTCASSNGSVSCAPVLSSYGMAAAAIWQVDPSVPIFINGLGQDYNDKWAHCGKAYPGMHWVSVRGAHFCTVIEINGSSLVVALPATSAVGWRAHTHKHKCRHRTR